MEMVRAMDLNTRFPALSDLRTCARGRIPKFVWEYLDSGTGEEATKARNRMALDRVGLTPSVLHGEFDPDLSVSLLGHDFPLPVGIAPVGMSGLIWPNAERMLAAAGARLGLPYTLSTVATVAPEDIAGALGPHANALREEMLASLEELMGEAFPEIDAERRHLLEALGD